MKLNQITVEGVERPAFLHLRDVNGVLMYDYPKAKGAEPIRVGVWLYGQDSKEFNRAKNAVQNRAMKRGRTTMTVEEQRENGVSLIVSCIDRWEGIEGSGPDGQVTSDEARAWLNAPQNGHFYEQIDKFIFERSNFTDAS